jgi:hypothetical protein
MEHVERELPQSLYSEQDIRCIGALVGEDSYLYYLATGQKLDLIPELSSFLTTTRLTTTLQESIEQELQSTTDMTLYSEALQAVIVHLISLCQRLGGEKLA